MTKYAWFHRSTRTIFQLEHVILTEKCHFWKFMYSWQQILLHFSKVLNVRKEKRPNTSCVAYILLTRNSHHLKRASWTSQRVLHTPMASTVTRPHAVSVKLLMVWYKSYPLTIQILFSALINLFPRVCCIYLDLMHKGWKQKKKKK